MKKRGLSSFIFVFILLLFFVPVVSAETENTDASIGLYILNLGKFDAATGSFTADFYLSMSCRSKCPEQNFEFMNGRAAPNAIDKIIDKPNEKFYRIQANLNSPVDLKKFPFDTQKMQIILEDKITTADELHYVPDIKQSGIDDSVVFPGWIIKKWSVEVKEHTYPIYNETYSQYIFTIEFSRVALNSFIKTFLPVLFIMLIVLFSFIIDPDKIPTRLGVVGSSLVGVVMFHVSIINQIPPVGYLTFADKFMLVSYAIILGSFMLNALMLELQELKRLEAVNKLHSFTEYSVFYIVPFIYAVFFLLAL
jgi:hypothetical protein